MAQAIAQKRMIEQYGPYGSQCPKNYSFQLQEGESIKEVIIRHGFIVDAIGFVVANPCGGTYTKMFGGTCGNESKIVLKSGENITRISGTYGNYIYQGGQCLIGTIKIHTNLCPNGYGPFGQGKGIECTAKDFSSPSTLNGPIVGVFGRHNNYLESVGIFVEKKKVQRYGPYGNDKAKENYSFQIKDDETITEVIVRSGFMVDAIGFTITGDDGVSSTSMYGGRGGNENKIKLQLGENITGISGRSKGSKMSQLRIHTDLVPRGHGPFGNDELKGGCDFQSPMPLCDNQEVIGFFGSAQDSVASIGLFVKNE